MTGKLSQATEYRTHSCGQLDESNTGQNVRLAGWVHRKRDHGKLVFLDLRDHSGITQCIFSKDADAFKHLDDLSLESVINIHGTVVKRSTETINLQLVTGKIEVTVEQMTVLSKADLLPLSVNSEAEFPEETRLKYRFLDLRRPHVHEAIVLRSNVITFIRETMINQGFLEIQTPILTATSPEGARDFVVPSRLYPGEFYALPQAPQQFKQLLMTSGFDKYFQVAPCFRDESSRADRSPGEFYQLDIEMAFVSQEDVFAMVEPVLYETFSRFAPAGSFVTSMPFPRITYAEAMLRYGSDKPDLRNPLIIEDMTSQLAISIFQPLIDQKAAVRVLIVPDIANESRKFFKDLGDFAIEQGASGLGYMTLKENEWQGPLVKFFSQEQKDFLHKKVPPNGGIFFVCDEPNKASILLGKLRGRLGKIDQQQFAFCWVTDFPMYEKDEETGAIIFSHNPFSMPQGGLEALCNQDPLTINAYQYDIICNGIELSSGAIRNHIPAIMYKAFEIAGYDKSHVEYQFGALLRAFHYGAPPHGGCAPGIDRIVMLLAGTQNIREVIAFPLNQQARDPLTGAPSILSAQRLNELHLTLKHSPVKCSKVTKNSDDFY